MRPYALPLLIAVVIAAFFVMQKTKKAPTPVAAETLSPAIPASAAGPAPRPSLPATPPATAPSAPPPDESAVPLAAPKMDLSAFRELTTQTQAALPKVSDLQKLSAAEVHHTPSVIREAGQALGQVAQAPHDHPEFADEGRAFYKECFMRVELPVQVRALCLADHRRLRAAAGQRPAWTKEEQTVPKDVLSLAEKIPLQN